jgi:hypothetical protein
MCRLRANASAGAAAGFVLTNGGIIVANLPAYRNCSATMKMSRGLALGTPEAPQLYHLRQSGKTVTARRIARINGREVCGRGTRDAGAPAIYRQSYSTVTLLARLRGWSTSVPLSTAV